MSAIGQDAVASFAVEDECYTSEYHESVFVAEREYDVASLAAATLDRPGEIVKMGDLKWSRRSGLTNRIIVGPDNQVYDGNKTLTNLERYGSSDAYVFRVTAEEIDAARLS